MIINSYRYAGVDPPLFDTFPSFWGISSRQLKTGVTTVERDRRSSDDAEQDFTATEKTDGTLTTFTGANDGFTVEPEDQSGNGLITQQTVLANQPKSVATGVVEVVNGKPSWNNTGKSGWLSTTNLVLTGTTEFWIWFVVNPKTISVAVLMETGIAAGEWSIQFATGILNIVMRTAGGASATSQFTLTTGQKLVALRLRSGLNVNAGATEVWFDGVSQSRTGGTPGVVGSFGDAILDVLARGGSSVAADVDLQEAFIRKGALSADRTSIQTNVNNHYSIF